MSAVAFIGLGTMGRGMARNLSRAGHEVTAWNRTRRPLPAELELITQVETLADAIRGKPVVFVCVTGPTLNAQCSTRRCSTIWGPTFW